MTIHGRLEVAVVKMTNDGVRLEIRLLDPNGGILAVWDGQQANLPVGSSLVLTGFTASFRVDGLPCCCHDNHK